MSDYWFSFYQRFHVAKMGGWSEGKFQKETGEGYAEMRRSRGENGRLKNSKEIRCPESGVEKEARETENAMELLRLEGSGKNGT